MRNRNYILREEYQGMFGIKSTEEVDVMKEKQIIEAIKDIKNSDIQNGLLKIGGLEK